MKMRSGNKGQAKWIMAVAGLCAAALLFAGFGGAHAEPAQKAAALRTPLAQLVAAGEAATQPGTPLRLVLKWQGTFAGQGEAARQAAEALAQRLGLGKVEAGAEDGHTAYRAVAAAGAGGKVSMFWSELGNGASYVIVTHETADWQRGGGFEAAAEATGETLQAAGITAEWNAALQGTAAAQDAPAAALNAVEAQLARIFTSPKAEEAYGDATTASRSYSVPGLARTVASGGHALALQAAVHRSSETGANRVTIGLPLITIEY